MPSTEDEQHRHGAFLDLFSRFRAEAAQLPDSHPARIALRTYSLALSLALGPAVVSLLSAKHKIRGGPWQDSILKHLSPTSFPFAITLGVAGGAALNAARHCEAVHLGPSITSYKSELQEKDAQKKPFRKLLARIVSWATSFDEERKAFACNLLSATLAILLLQIGYRRRWNLRVADTVDIPLTLPNATTGGRISPTLDLTLLFCVRALDSLVQRGLSRAASFKTPENNPNEETQSKHRQELEKASSRLSNEATIVRRTWTGYLDAATFWASSARIMWCFFYAPDRLPISYVKWISALADIDTRLVEALRAIRGGTFSYVKGTMPPRLTTTMVADMGCPPAWGDPSRLPAYGNHASGTVYESLSVKGRHGLGGLPCEVVHGRVDQHSCVANSARRGGRVFLKALLIYTPVQFLPLLWTNPRFLLSLPRIFPPAFAVAQSSAFLSTFVGSIWLAVCLTRTLFLARLFPGVSHDFWDGPQGCVLAGCLTCGSSIFVESARRRGEIALYVLPRAVRASIPERWLRNGQRVTRVTERAAFALSLATLLTAGVHRPDTLRGMARWMLAFVMKGGTRKPKMKPAVTSQANGSSDGVPHQNGHP